MKESDGETIVQRRSCRSMDAPARVINVSRLSRRRVFAEGKLYTEDTQTGRPKTRGDCENTERPCPYVGCTYHLAIDVDPTSGAIKINFPDVELDEMTETCALDVADAGGATLEEVASYTNLTRERVRQLEQKALAILETVGDELRDAARDLAARCDHVFADNDD